MRTWELQQAVIKRLRDSMGAASATGVYNHAPQNAKPPYIVVGEDLATPDDTDDSLGSSHLLTLHTWSRHRGQRETKEIQQAIYDALHRQPLFVANAMVVDCNLESQDSFLDADGKTRHGVQRFRVLLEEVNL